MDLSFMAAQVWDVWHYALKIWVLHEHQPVHFKAVQHVSLELKILIHPLMWFHFFWQLRHAFLYNLTSTRETGFVYWLTFLIFNMYIYLLFIFTGFLLVNKVSHVSSGVSGERSCPKLCSDWPRYQSQGPKVRDLSTFSNISQHVIWTAPRSFYTYRFLLWQLLRNVGLFIKKLPFK